MREGAVRLFHGTAAIVAVSLLCGLPLLMGRVLAGDDIPFFLLYGQQAGANMREGIFLPAWAADLNAGFGGPALLFYPPLTNWVHGLSLVTGAYLPFSIGYLAIIAHLLSGLTFWKAVRIRVPEGQGIVAAIAYMVAPYRLIDMYDRGALGEHWSFIFPPLFIGVMSDTRLKTPQRTALVALIVALLCLTNLPAAVLFGCLLGVWTLVIPETRRHLRSAVGGSLLGGALAAFALLPQALSARWVRSELFYGSAGGPYQTSANTLFSSSAKDLVLNQFLSWGLAATTAIAVVAFIVAVETWKKGREGKFWLVAAITLFVLALPWAGLLWDHTPILRQIQFPWRLGGPLTMAMALLIAHARNRAWVTALLVMTAICGAPFVGRATVPAAEIKASRPADERGRRFPDPMAMYEAGRLGEFAPFRSLNDPWFLPRSASPALWQAIFAKPDREFLFPGAGWVNSGPSSVEVTKWGRLGRQLLVKTPRDTLLVWRMISFEGMSLLLDGKPAAMITDRLGLLATPIPAGSHLLEWRWEPTGVFRIGRWTSLVALTAVLLLLSGARVPRRKTVVSS